jgi:REP element-mobilizing transposase RayT
LLKEDAYKDIVIDSLQWLTDEQKVLVHGFVIMPNHIHILWSIISESGQHPKQSLLSYTSHKFKQKLQGDNSPYLQEFISTQSDREYHFWERHSKTIDARTRDAAFQMINYIHTNPMQDKWQLVTKEEEYKYSSAEYYYKEVTVFPFLKSVYDYV